MTYVSLAAVFCIATWPGKPGIHHFVGAIITGLAFTLWIIARIQLGNAFSIAPKSKYLVTSGLYGKLRHPVYYFSILAVLGLVVFTWQPNLTIPLAILIPLQMLRIRKEEQLLLGTFGDEYRQYKSRTWF